MFHRLLIIPIILLVCIVLVLYGIIHTTIRICKHKATKKDIIYLCLSLMFVIFVTYGFTFGFNQFEVKHVEIEFDNLPTSFQNYKIVMFSDAHLGNFKGKRQNLLYQAVDSINAQQPNLICFCGDIENASSEEIMPFLEKLATLKATDGVISVLGNHDYALYQHNLTEEQKAQELQRTINVQRSAGWKVLRNEHLTIYNNKDSIVICGEENDGKKPFPNFANSTVALQGVKDNAFIIMLQHDPTAWKRQVLKETNASLTLSGHTHAGQFKIFGWTPVSMLYDEYDGLYTSGNRILYVSGGLGGVVPFRIGATREIVVITLKRPTSSISI
ncbi:MAG: metallophosphoesterase [Prevotellaceae bacterium]|nr:metallophosphoesterase [Prevotellaceae bacterium]